VVECTRPLLGAAQVEGQAAALQHGAVDDAGWDRRDLARGDGDHDLVEQDEPRLGFSDHDPCLTQAEVRQGEEVRIPEATGELRRPAERLRRPRRIPGVHRTERLGNEQESRARAGARIRLHESLGTREPSGAPGAVSEVHELHPEPGGASGRSRHVLGVEERLVRAGQRVDALLRVPHQDLRGGEVLEVLSRDRAVVLRPLQLGDRLAPAVFAKCGAAPIEGGRRVHDASKARGSGWRRGARPRPRAQVNATPRP
jgi:hypothetical protein